MGAYSLDLRTRVLADWDAGMKAEEVAAQYRVSRAWVNRLVQRRRETGEGDRPAATDEVSPAHLGGPGAAPVGDGATRSHAR